jgi:hypothetical protein
MGGLNVAEPDLAQRPAAGTHRGRLTLKGPRLQLEGPFSEPLNGRGAAYLFPPARKCNRDQDDGERHQHPVLAVNAKNDKLPHQPLAHGSFPEPGSYLAVLTRALLPGNTRTKNLRSRARNRDGLRRRGKSL